MSSSIQHRISSSTTVPPRPAFVIFEFPLLITKWPYDNHEDGFWDFPERTGWVLDGQRRYRKFPTGLTEVLIPVLDKMDGKNYRCRRKTVPESMVKARPNDALSIKCFREDTTQASLDDEVAFLQSWLFFGTLAEMNIITGVPTPDFGVEGAKAILSTAAFDDLIHSWAAAIKGTSGDNDCHQIRGQMLGVIQHVMTLQTCISTVRSKVKEPRKLSYDHCKVLLAIRILFRAILLALALSSGPEARKDIQLLMDPTLTQSFPANWDDLKEYATKEMLAVGWCRSECTLLEAYDGAYNFFAARMVSGRWRMDHNKCHDRLCNADSVNEDTYTTVHVQERCECEWVEVSSQELCDVLDRGKVPRIGISEDMKLVVDDQQAYVAISHVWAHGLGNPRKNALPRCQIERLASYISDFQAVGEVPGLAIWMDTLCIPVHPNHKSYRKKAIKMMSQTYLDAATVLILDRELQRLDTNNVSLLEQDLITVFVGWTRRLWTLQEAALADRLYVQTLRSPYKLDNKGSQEKVQFDIKAQICFRQDIAVLTGLRIPPMATLKQSVQEKVSHPTPGPMYITTTALQKLAHAIKHRSTSKMEDEAVILAITLGFDPEPVLSACDVDARMEALLILLKDVPADIIFGDWPKIAHSPYRWAPRSLLGLPLQAMQSFGPAAVCDSHGLHATYEGFLVEHGDRQIGPVGVCALDKASGMKYEFQTRSGDALFQLPEACALIFRHYGSADMAVVRVLSRRANDDEEDVIDAIVVGLLTLVGSGAGLDVTGQPILEGMLTASNQRWCIV